MNINYCFEQRVTCTNELPSDIFWEVGKNLKSEEVAICTLVCKRWKVIFGNEELFWSPKGLKNCDVDIIFAISDDEGKFGKLGQRVYTVCANALKNYDFEKAVRCYPYLKIDQKSSFQHLYERYQQRQKEDSGLLKPSTSRRKLNF